MLTMCILFQDNMLVAITEIETFHPHQAYLAGQVIGR